ncbi:MAG: hypothetical protein WD768_12175 [Phycisphaeraceae bacterium]
MVVLIIAVLASIVLVSIGHTRKSVNSGACLSQVRQLTMGLRQYAVDNKQMMPDPSVSGVSWAQSIQSYVGDPAIFACPGDMEVFPLTGLSYDWRDTGDPSTTMAGRLFDQVTRTSAILTFESLPSWHAEGKINAGWIDGSTHTMDETACFKDLLTPVRLETRNTP